MQRWNAFQNDRGLGHRLGPKWVGLRWPQRSRAVTGIGTHQALTRPQHSRERVSKIGGACNSGRHPPNVRMQFRIYVVTLNHPQGGTIMSPCLKRHKCTHGRANTTWDRWCARVLPTWHSLRQWLLLPLLMLIPWSYDCSASLQLPSLHWVSLFGISTHQEIFVSMFKTAVKISQERGITEFVTGLFTQNSKFFAISSVSTASWTGDVQT